jgi:hypothetical protein
MGSAAGAARQPESPDPGLSHISVTRAANAALRELRASAPQKAQLVDDLIKNIPNVRSEPVRIVGPESQQRRVYRAAIPPSSEAPVVIYRSLEPDESPQAEWLVTALVDRTQYEDYRQAEMRGILDNPWIAPAIGRLGNLLADAIRSEQGGTRSGSG